MINATLMRNAARPQVRTHAGLNSDQLDLAIKAQLRQAELKKKSDKEKVSTPVVAAPSELDLIEERARKAEVRAWIDGWLSVVKHAEADRVQRETAQRIREEEERRMRASARWQYDAEGLLDDVRSREGLADPKTGLIPKPKRKVPVASAPAPAPALASTPSKKTEAKAKPAAPSPASPSSSNKAPVVPEARPGEMVFSAEALKSKSYKDLLK